MTLSALGGILLEIASGRIPAETPDDIDCADELRQALSFLRELERFGIALSQGDLSAQIRGQGRLAGSLKGLQASLRHLTWQTRQVADGDLTQQVDFMGEFAAAFNTMVVKLGAAREELSRKNRELGEAYADLKDAQLQLLQQEKMASVGQLAAGIAHEINTPLGFIMSNLGSLNRYAAKLGEYMAAQEEAVRDLLPLSRGGAAVSDRVSGLKSRLKIDFIMQDMTEMIQESLSGAGTVKKIVEDLKKFVRLDEALCQAVVLNDCLDSAVALLAPTPETKVSVSKQYQAIPAVNCSPALLNQAFMAILQNAVQSITAAGMIVLQTRSDEDAVYAVISDNGCGIPAENVGRVFDPFFTTRPVGKATGLGLSVAYSIVTNHGGEITIESAEGEGTTVTVRLPRAGSG
jgi:two-component system NtrC family sensor kinase